MNDGPHDASRSGILVTVEPLERLPSLDARLVSLRQTYCRDLVQEGRLDWDGFDLGDVDVDPVVTAEPHADGRTRSIGRESPRRRRWRRRRP
jgi:hypothetical protein